MSDPPISPRRGFRLGDGMILIASIAVGFALCRSTLQSFLPAPPRRMLAASSFQTVRDSLLYLPPILAPCTFACLLIRMRGPRPPRRELFEYVGTAATASAALIILIRTVVMTVLVAAGTRTDFIASPIGLSSIDEPGCGVLGAWSLLLLGGRWRLERSWIDWLGSGLGALWVAIAIAWWLAFGLIK
jgi:hypothetical protein